MFDQTNHQVISNYLAIEKYQKKQGEMKLLAGVSCFANFIIVVPNTIDTRPDSLISIIIYWILFFSLVIIAFAFDSKYAKKIKLYEIKNYEIETEALARKIKVAEIRHEKLLDVEINKRIEEPDLEVVYPYKYYIIAGTLHILLGIWLVAALCF
ncbi:MAG: hypothetical protein K6B41_09210 [Butyrivibrio sp.]|nr:hypothetical protein [Butyrivibrio sp.]